MKTLTLSDSFKEMIERNQKQSKVCKYFMLADKLPLTIKGSGINYLTTREGGLISYLPKGKACMLNDDGKWARNGRQEARASGVLREVFSARLFNRLSNTDIEVFTNIIRGYECQAPFEIVKEWEIVSVYDEDNSPITAISGSCMQDKGYIEDNNGNDCSLVQLYALNPDKIEMLVFRDEDGRLIGRALKWLTDCGNYVVDRSYARQDVSDKINELCSVNGWYKKQYNNYQDKDQFIYNGEYIRKSFAVTLSKVAYSVPYLDMFTYFEPKGSGAVLRNTFVDGVIFNTCSETGGYFSNERVRWCPIIDGTRSADSFTYSKFYKRDVVKADCYNTDKGYVYSHDLERHYALIYKGARFTNFESVNLYKFNKKPNKQGFVASNDVQRVSGYKLGNGRLIRDDEHTTQEAFYLGVERDKDGKHTGRKIKLQRV